MLRFLLMLISLLGCMTTGIAQVEVLQFIKARASQVKTIETGAYEITTKMKHAFDTDTLEFRGRGFFEHKQMEDTTFYKIHTDNLNLNTSYLYSEQANTFHIVYHDEASIEEWKKIPNAKLQSDNAVFEPLVLNDYLEKKISWSDSVWLAFDTLLNANVLHFLDKEAPPSSQVKLENIITKIYFNSNGIPFKEINQMDWVDYGVSQYTEKKIHFFRSNIPPLSNMNKIYAERKYTYVDGLQKEKVHEKKRDIAQIQLGTIAPTWQATTYTGQAVDFSKISGKLILLDFWYKGCFPCMQSMPLLNKLHHKYAAKGLKIIGINPYQSDAEEMLSFLRKKNIEHPNIYSKSIPGQYGVFAYPTYIFLDQDRKVLRVQRGYGKGETDIDFEEWIINYLENASTTN